MTWDKPRLTPYHWWGDAWSRPNARSLAQLVTDSVLTPDQALQLETQVSSGRSVVICASASGVGKSTLANALIPFIPSVRTRMYIRGTHEQFGWQRQIDPDHVTLLVNEISPHLPVYLWGDALASVLDLARDGAQVLATAHAESPVDLLRSLKLASSRISRGHVVALGLIVVLDDSELQAPARVACIENIRDSLGVLPD